MTPEDRIRAAILEYQTNTERALTEASQAGKEGLASWIKELLDGLTVVMPIGVKPILDAGGAIRQVELKSEHPGAPSVDIGWSGGSRSIQLWELRPATRFRLTVLVEPLFEDSGRKSVPW